MPRFWAETAASCWMMSKKVDSSLLASCQHWATVQVRICSLFQLCGAAVLAEGVMVAVGEGAGFCAEAARVAAARARLSVRRWIVRMRSFLWFRVLALRSGASRGGRSCRGGC